MKNEAKVGVFIFIGLVFLFFLTTQVSKFKNFSKEGYTLYAVLDNVGGLEKNSKIKANGIDAGYVEDMAIDTNKIKVKLFLYDSVKIPQDSSIKLVQDSMLGGKHVAIALGDSSESLQKDGFVQSQKEMAGFNEASDNLALAASEFRLFIQEFREIMDEDSRSNLKNTFVNLEQITSELRKFAKVNKLNETADNFNNMAINLSSAGSQFATTADTLNKQLPEILAKLDTIMTDFKNLGVNLKDEVPQIAQKFSKLEDELDAMIKKNKKPLNNALTSADNFFSTGGDTFQKVDDFLNAMVKVQLEVGMRGEYLESDGYAKSYFSLNYIPNESRYYMIDIVSGNDYSRLDENDLFIEPKKHEDKNFLFSAQLGKRYDDLLLRGGIIENTGGVGMDYYFFNDKLKATAEVFDFDAQNDVRGDNPHAKVSLRYTMLKHLDTYIGYDNFLNEESSNVMVGFGIHFIDDDLKTLLSTQNIGSFVK